jgi:hypothetical protein
MSGCLAGMEIELVQIVAELQPLVLIDVVAVGIREALSGEVIERPPFLAQT